jgi:hypothetical protein
VTKPQGYRQAASAQLLCFFVLCFPYYQSLLFAGISGMISVPADFPAHIRGFALAGDQPRHFRLPEGPPAVVGRSNLRPQRSSGERALVCRSSRPKSGSFLPASPSALFLIPVA